MLNLKALLIKILTEITPVTQTVTIATGKTVTLRRYGNMVFIRSQSSVTTTANTYVNWFTVPEGFRPAQNEYMPALLGGAVSGFGFVLIQPDGQAKIFSHWSFSNQGIWFSGCYML